MFLKLILYFIIIIIIW